MWMKDSDFGWKWIPDEIIAEMIADGVDIPDPDPLDDDPRAERDPDYEAIVVRQWDEKRAR